MDVYESLVELGRVIYGGDEHAAQRFAIGRAGSEYCAREELGTLAPAGTGPGRKPTRAAAENAIFTQLRAAGVPTAEAQRRARAAVSGVVAEGQAVLDRPSTGTLVVETSGAPAAGRGPGKMLIKLISAGWSANGRFYGEAVLRRDGARAFPIGTQMHVDHATDSEQAERPYGSLRTLAGVLEADARYDDTAGGLVAPARLFQPWRDTLSDMAPHIGVSIQASVLGDHGQAEGRSGFVVEELVQGVSVDFVTRAAAGGRVLTAEGRW